MLNRHTGKEKTPPTLPYQSEDCVKDVSEGTLLFRKVCEIITYACGLASLIISLVVLMR